MLVAANASAQGEFSKLAAQYRSSNYQRFDIINEVKISMYRQLTDNIYRFHASLSLSSEDSAIVHGTNERVSIKAFERAVDITQALVRGAGSRQILF